MKSRLGWCRLDQASKTWVKNGACTTVHIIIKTQIAFSIIYTWTHIWKKKVVVRYLNHSWNSGRIEWGLLYSCRIYEKVYGDNRMKRWHPLDFEPHTPPDFKTRIYNSLWWWFQRCKEKKPWKYRVVGDWAFEKVSVSWWFVFETSGFRPTFQRLQIHLQYSQLSPIASYKASYIYI